MLNNENDTNPLKPIYRKDNKNWELTGFVKIKSKFPLIIIWLKDDMFSEKKNSKKASII